MLSVICKPRHACENGTSLIPTTNNILTAMTRLHPWQQRCIHHLTSKFRAPLPCQAKTRKPSTLAHKTTWIYNAKQSAVCPKWTGKQETLRPKFTVHSKPLYHTQTPKVSMLSTCVAVFFVSHFSLRNAP